jgi:hypothetical protein
MVYIVEHHDFMPEDFPMEEEAKYQGGVGGPRCGRHSLFLHREILGQEIMVLNDVDHGVEQKNKQKPNAKPLPGAPNVGEEILRPGGGTHLP